MHHENSRENTEYTLTCTYEEVPVRHGNNNSQGEEDIRPFTPGCAQFRGSQAPRRGL